MFRLYPHGGVALVINIFSFPSVSSLLGWATLLIGLFIVLWLGRRQPRIGAVLLTALALRTGAALTHYYVTALPDGIADAANFERRAWQLAQLGFSDMLDAFTTGSGLYPWLIAHVYMITDRSPLMMQGINVLFGTLIVYNVYQTSRFLWGEPIAKRAAWVAALLPLLILYAAVTRREVAVVYPLTLGILYFVRWHKTYRPQHLAFSIAALVVSMASHPATLGALIAIALVASAKWFSSFLAFRKNILLPISAAVIVGGVLVGVVVTSDLGRHFEQLASPEFLESAQDSRLSGRAAYPEWMVVRSPEELVWKTPVRVVYLLFTPFPWMVEKPLDAFGLLNVGVNLMLAGLLWRNRRQIWRNPAARGLLLALIGMMLILALGTSNYGTATRHAAKLLPLMIILVQVPHVVLWRSAVEQRARPAPIPDHRPLPRGS